MNLLEIIREHPTINITVKGSDLLEFAETIANQAAKNALAQNQEKLYTRDEVMEKFGVCSATLWRWNKSGIIQGKKIGRRHYYTEKEILQLLSNQQSNNF